MMQEHIVFWLAGLLEGEGSFMKGPPSNPSQCKISLQMTDLDIVERVAVMFGTGIDVRKPQNPNHKESYVTCIRGLCAVEWMDDLQPLMGTRRRQQIADAVKSYHDNISRRVITHEDVRRMCALSAQGHPYKYIAEQLDCSRSTVQKYVSMNMA